MKTLFNLFIVVFIASTFSNFSYAQTCLPINSSVVKLEKYKAPAYILETKLYDNTVYLKWTCCQHPEDSYFLVQKSSDGYNFKTIGVKKCFGDSIKINLLYCFTDQLTDNPENTIYYRIVKPMDDNYMYSNICTVKSTLTKHPRLVDNRSDF